MAWVITRLCRDCIDMSCVEVCPVDCIYQYRGEDREAFPNQLFIDPEECIDCGVCESECPWEAIFQDGEVPGVFQEDIDLNARITGVADARGVPEKEEKIAPTPQQVEENRSKWGYTR